MSESAFVGEKFSFVTTEDEAIRMWVVGKDETLTIRGVTYTQIRIVREHIKLFEAGALSYEGWNLYYFSEGVGLVRFTEAYEDGSPSMVVFDLDTYDLAPE